ncbi:electron transfer flavoprotein subunit beta [Thermocladium modestius]|uniref:Electron transfer flavoprotein subunit beta n=1 Tax=Thermocladium modestius TaxID=62609 RepID=A0A830GYB9_9CREN|nr:electron transfer flavoprotein subunit beta/FixA family protein [Thermocladium modestius]GGP22193.1 electron transfer flavoprotein subunit beta [Thermocladium modestius]
MNIVVLVKPALDTSNLRTAANKIMVEDTPLKISDIDRNAAEEAIRLKEKMKGGKTIAVMVSKYPPIAKRGGEAENLAREVLAMGIDEAILVIDDGLIGTDQTATAKAIVETIRKKVGQFDVIIGGEATIDGYSSQVPARIAAELGIPIITYVREISQAGSDFIVVKRDLEDEVQVVRSKLPVVMTVTREINTPRIPPLLQIRMAMKKPLSKVSLSDLGLQVQVRARTTDLKPLQIQRKKVLIESGTVEEKADKLIQYLSQEGIITPR